MERYLITGGAGFIGSHITERLIREGNYVRVLDNFSSGSRGNLSHLKGANLEIIEGDIRDRDTCRKAVQSTDYILHQAALRSVPRSFEQPHEYDKVNIGGTLNMLEAAVENNAKSFVFASSSSVYGDTDAFPEKEDAPPSPISPYALSKLAGEYYCRIFTRFYGLKAFILRYFNVFGPRQSLDDDYAVVVPKFITSVMEGRMPPVYGDGKQSRDFTFVDNVVEANILAARSKNGAGNVYNVAAGRDHTVLELLESICRIMGKRADPDFKPPRKGDVRRTLADVSRIEKELGYKTKTDFKNGLKKTIEWFEEKQH
ncbi:MAG: SDR family oxidoreductase [Candidatus Omnitrophica bacterium]|nr:SDR family oxidoreductase [Candidatus Omnitrophota bacterium]